MPIYKILIHTKTNDPRNGGYLRDSHALGFQCLQSIKVQDLYFIEGQLSQEDLQQLTLKLLTDNVTQTAEWTELPAALSTGEPDSIILETQWSPPRRHWTTLHPPL
jgi:hypothetical protein